MRRNVNRGLKKQKGVLDWFCCPWFLPLRLRTSVPNDWWSFWGLFHIPLEDVYCIITGSGRLRVFSIIRIRNEIRVDAGTPDHEGNQCVRNTERAPRQPFAQDTWFNKARIDTADVLHTSWLFFLIMFTDQPVIEVSRPTRRHV